MKDMRQIMPCWSGMMHELISGMTEWRQQHPKATLREIETEMDKRWVRVRVRMVSDLALSSGAADWGDEKEQPVCPHCGEKVTATGGKTKRHVQTHGGEEIVLERRYGVCPTCEVGFFPPGRGTGVAAWEPE